MSKAIAVLGSALFFVIAPLVLAGFVPWWVTQWEFRTAFFGVDLTRILGGILIIVGVLAAVINNTFFGDGQAKGGLGEMPSASRRDTVPCMHSGESGKCGNPSCDAPSGCPSADLAVLSTVMSRSKR